MDPYEIMMSMILVLTPIICWFFTRTQKEHRTPWRQWATEFHEKRYYLHAMGYIVIIRWKAITDKLNEPMKVRTGHWTEWVYGIEGEFTKWFQDVFRSDVITEFLNFHYLFVYLGPQRQPLRRSKDTTWYGRGEGMDTGSRKHPRKPATCTLLV